MNKLRSRMTGATKDRAAWTEDEEQRLCVLYPRAPWSEILAELPGRNKRACMKRAFALGIKREMRDATPEARVKWIARGKGGIRRGTGNPIVVIDGVEGKVCTSCKVWASLERFSRHPDCAGGKRNTCDACQARRSRKWAIKNPETVSANARRWQKNHPEHHRAIRQAGRNTRHGRKVSGRVMATELRVRSAEFHQLCGYCLAPAQQFDHMTPLAKGGRHEIENIIPACAKCNGEKHDRSLLEYLVFKHEKAKLLQGDS